MKKTIILVFCWLLGLALSAQESKTAFGVLKLPTSAHVAALGGENNSTLDDDPAAAQHNPALFASVLHRTLGFTFMTYGDGAKWLGAQYVHAHGQRHTFGTFAQYMNYGTLSQTDESGVEIGTFTPKDLIFGLGYSYLLSENWAGGANLKWVHLSIADFHSSALVVDVGVNYFDQEHQRSLSLVLRNAGAQLYRYDGLTENLPYSLQMGYSQRLEHTPLRWTLTLVDLTRWDRQYYYVRDGETMSFARLLFNHVVVGADVYLSPQLSLAVGYNFRRAYELGLQGAGLGAGFTTGLSLVWQGMKLQLAWARYNKHHAALMGTMAYTF